MLLQGTAGLALMRRFSVWICSCNGIWRMQHYKDELRCSFSQGTWMIYKESLWCLNHEQISMFSESKVTKSSISVNREFLRAVVDIIFTSECSHKLYRPFKNIAVMLNQNNIYGLVALCGEWKNIATAMYTVQYVSSPQTLQSSWLASSWQSVYCISVFHWHTIWVPMNSNHLNL